MKPTGKTWQVRDWLSGYCCGLDGAVEVETFADGGEVYDGDRARCVLHGCVGTVYEACGHMTIEWDDEEPENNGPDTAGRGE